MTYIPTYCLGLMMGPGIITIPLRWLSWLMRAERRRLLRPLTAIYRVYMGIILEKSLPIHFRKPVRYLRGEQIPVHLMPGMEVFATIDLPQLLADGKIMPINQTRYVLIEFDFGEDPDFADEILRQVADIHAWPVVAHVERYEFVQDDPQIIYRWLTRGYAIQVNKGSFLGRFGRRAERTAYRLLNHNLISVIASDAHGSLQRTTYMADAYESLAEDYPESYLDTLFTRNPENICRGRRVIRFRKIPFRGGEYR